MILVVDNFDSFTYNLVHYLDDLGAETKVVRNDAVTADEALAMAPDAMLLDTSFLSIEASVRKAVELVETRLRMRNS